MHRSELTVDLGAIRRNARTLLRVLDGSQLWAVVKADAYGHGAVPIAAALEAAGADGLCVATIDEGLELRQAGIELPILVLYPVPGTWLDVAREQAIDVTQELDLVGEQLDVVALDVHLLEQDRVRLVDVVERPALDFPLFRAAAHRRRALRARGQRESAENEQN